MGHTKRALALAIVIIVAASAFAALDGLGNSSNTASADTYPVTVTDEPSLVSALNDLNTNPAYASYDTIVIESASPIQLTAALQVDRSLAFTSVNGATLYSANGLRHIVVGSGSDIGDVTLTFDNVTLDGHVVASGNISGGGVVYMDAAGRRTLPTTPRRCLTTRSP
ncbi:MAG: hypothetical protein LBT41_03615 [Candidatus Methanoplasma sp.]|nr:hypothetical protein [Candidatus Methanoplasma sp.]